MRTADAIALIASGDITRYSLVKPDGSGGVVLATAATDPIFGVTTDVDTPTGNACDVQTGRGIVFIQLGGTVAAGDMLTANAIGRAVKAAPAAGANNRVGAIALEDGVSGDIIRAVVKLAVLQG